MTNICLFERPFALFNGIHSKWCKLDFDTNDAQQIGHFHCDSNRRVEISTGSQINAALLTTASMGIYIEVSTAPLNAGLIRIVTIPRF